MRCVTDDCESEAVAQSNYCYTHQPRKRYMSRLDESTSEFSEYDGDDSAAPDSDDDGE